MNTVFATGDERLIRVSTVYINMLRNLRLFHNKNKNIPRPGKVVV